MKFVLLKNVSEEESAVLRPLLEANGITLEKRYSALAAPSKVYSGRSVFGNALYVLDTQLEEARELLSKFSEGIPPDELEALALANGECEPESADFDWYAAGYGFDRGDRLGD